MYHILLSNLSILVTFKRNWVINYSIIAEWRDLNSSMGKTTKEILTEAQQLQTTLPAAGVGALSAAEQVLVRAKGCTFI